ncbi:unnamed protein product [Brassica oleracea var. botrytis]|uniref:Uncharacterized protein n=1 Tax=Brassica cretica TaxID=69181 RepID=A0A8S9PH38_BRACR|nr:hypothetical protein F2Q69_00004072 [Brassica cretica]
MLDLSQPLQSDSIEFGARGERSNEESIFGLSEQSQKQTSGDVCVSSNWRRRKSFYGTGEVLQETMTEKKMWRRDSHGGEVSFDGRACCL